MINLVIHMMDKKFNILKPKNYLKLITQVNIIRMMFNQL